MVSWPVLFDQKKFPHSTLLKNLRYFIYLYLGRCLRRTPIPIPWSSFGESGEVKSCITQCCGAASHSVVELHHTVLWSYITRCCGATSHSVVELHHTVLWSYITQCCEATSHSVVELHHSVVELHHTVLWSYITQCCGAASQCCGATSHSVVDLVQFLLKQPNLCAGSNSRSIILISWEMIAKLS